MSKKVFKRIVCALLTLAMLAGMAIVAPVSAVSDKSIAVDFTDSGKVDSSVSGVTCTPTKDGVKFSQKPNNGTNYYGVKLTDCPIVGNVYEISYWTEATDLNDRVVLQIYRDRSGYIGWNSVQGNTNKMMIFRNGQDVYGNDSSTLFTLERDTDTAKSNRQYFRVTVDGINMKMTLYVLSGGQYKKAAETPITTGGSFENYLQPRLLNWDAIEGSNHIAVGGVTIKRQPSLDERISVKGYQRKDADDGTYALRFTAGLGSADYTDYGMIIKCKINGTKAYRFDIKDGEKLSEITEEKNGSKKKITAESLGAEALYTAVVEGLPSDAKEMTVEVIPYCTEGKTRLEGTVKKLIIKNGEIVTFTEYELAKNTDRIKIYGRSAALTTGIACDFSASGIEFNAELEGDLKLKVSSSGKSYYTLYIDGVRQDKRLEFSDGTAEYTILSGLAKKKYNIKLIKQTQVTHSISSFMTLSMNGRLLERPLDKELLIEFAGDSITCGYALIGYPTPGVDNYRGAAHMDASQSYAYLAAQNLGADHSFVSASGWSVIPDANGSSSIPGIYGKTSYRRGDAAYVPTRTADIVVIHLGTNDSFSRDTFATEYVPQTKAFVQDVWKMNPDAKIVFAYGSMMSGSRLTTFKGMLDTIIKDLGGTSKGVYSVQLPTDTSGGHNHPSVDGHVRSAKILSDYISQNVIK